MVDNSFEKLNLALNIGSQLLYQTKIHKNIHNLPDLKAPLQRFIVETQISLVCWPTHKIMKFMIKKEHKLLVLFVTH